MHRLSSSFVLGYHGCDKQVGENLIAGLDFKPSKNDYDWLGPGIYFLEANPQRGQEFAEEIKALDRGPKIKTPWVVGAVIDLGLCLDLTTSAGIQQVHESYSTLRKLTKSGGYVLPSNNKDLLRRNLDCAVIETLHRVRKDKGLPPVDTVRGIFVEGEAIYKDSGFFEKTHIQICVCNYQSVKGVFRVPSHQLS